jgi:hypothetical protein
MISQMAIAVVDPPRFPRVCINCCSPASTQLEVGRVHHAQSQEGSASREVRTAFRPFFCAACAAQHLRELPPFDWSLVGRRILAMWTYLIPAAGSFFVMYILAPVLIRGALRGRPSDLFLSGGIFLFFALLCLVCLVSGWLRTAHLVPKPITSISSAIEFTGDQSETFEPTWRRYTFRNDAYTEQFRAANAPRLWDRHSTRARRAFTLRQWFKWVIWAALGCATLWYLWDEWLRPLWNWAQS